MDYVELVRQISILIGIWVAIYGIDSWRREHKGKRQIELAEDTLAMFYEAADAIKFIRHPMGSTLETEKIKQGEHESEEQFQARKDASVVYIRHNEYQELFNKIHASRYRFMAQIGKDEAAPFDDLRKTINKIMSSARVLARLWPRNSFRNDEQWQKHQEKIKEHESVIYEGLEEDPINPKIEKIVSDIEKTCQSIISGKGTLHGLLNIKIGKSS